MIPICQPILPKYESNCRKYTHDHINTNSLHAFEPFPSAFSSRASHEFFVLTRHLKQKKVYFKENLDERKFEKKVAAIQLISSYMISNEMCTSHA